MDLKGKTVVYIGGFGGIGQKCLRAFLRKEIKHLVVCDLHINEIVLKDLVESFPQITISYVAIDITERDSIEGAIKEAALILNKQIDIFVNGCGLMNDRFVDLTICINLIGLIHSSLTALDYMSKSKGGNGGSIINISSIAGLDPSEYFCIYSASKSGVISFTQSMARPLYFDKTGINFITICPGGTLTTIIQQADTCYSNQYFDGLVDVLNGMDKQTPEVFAKNLMEIVETADNGTVWVLNNGTIEEVHMPKVWGQINLDSTIDEHQIFFNNKLITMDLVGKNVIYVGGFGGIGQKCVEAFLEKSVKSIFILDLVSNDEYLKHLQETYKNSCIEYHFVDLTKRQTIEIAFEKIKNKLGSFDIVVNGAGIGDEENIDILIHLNLTGLIHSSLIAMEHMSKANGGFGGCIVNISSTLGLDGSEFYSIYSSSKCGVTAFTRSMANSIYFDKTGVSFITICPGATETEMLRTTPSKCFSSKYFHTADLIASIKTQTAAIFAKNFIEVVETASNGTTWALDNSAVHKINFPQIYRPLMDC
ncbi:uncharacterized protein LOC142236014 [Haematobia irritans]|uniref:uncharacterized protein LOC142236014 n=1 Tax=Haematobia irritans TaxID=7368 RepID=UPI003F50797D